MKKKQPNRKLLNRQQAEYFGFTFPPLEKRYRKDIHRFILTDEQLDPKGVEKNRPILQE